MIKLEKELNAAVIAVVLLLSCPLVAQTTFIEDATSYGLNIGFNKDGGHAWADFDNDGDLDVLVLLSSTMQRNRLMRNNGNGTFTNVQPTLVSGMLPDFAERQAAWGDVNNDGLPDFLMTSSGNGNHISAMQIFVQNDDGTFGDGDGGSAPITVGRNGYTIDINQVNIEGAGFFDFEGDGDLDIFFDSHNNGIELLRNNYINHITHTVVDPIANSLFTHITTGGVDFGLNQNATDGDYGTAADVNDDGWVDIFMRKRDENDFFLNQGGVFTSGADLAQAQNNNKGGNGLWDLDNDGDLDAVWTENGRTQIFRNDSNGVFTPLGSMVFPGLPQPSNIDLGSSSARIDALAGGDIDNDGDIDIILVGNSRSYLYINQLNSPTPAPGQVGSGTAMTFSLDSQAFNSQDGEGVTMVDIDNDGDLDIYFNINGGANQLFINGLSQANRNNHLIIEVVEDRGADGSVGAFSGRTALGANIIIKDCSGTIVSGLRQVNGTFGHGTQQSPLVHFGLPLGENRPYLIEVHYPNLYNESAGSITRLVATAVAEPNTIVGTNHYSLTTTDAEALENPNAPIANDDIETVSYGNSVSVQISLFDNDTEPDGDNFTIESITQPAIGNVVVNDADAGLITYTYNGITAFSGTDFTYTISDATVTVCPGSGKNDTATVTIYEPCADPSGVDTDGDGINDPCDIDDDNDGILDVEESCAGFNGEYYGSNGNISNINEALATTTGTPEATFIATNINFNRGAGDLGVGTHLQNFLGNDSGSLSNDPITASKGVILMDGQVYLEAGTYNLRVFSDDGYRVRIDGNDVAVRDANQAPTARVHNDFVIAANGFYPVDFLYWDQGGNYVFRVEMRKGSDVYNVISTSTSPRLCADSDNDGIVDSVDLDSDNDGIPDNVEAQTTLGYIAPSGIDSDGNGLDDAYELSPGSGEGLVPVNTDGTDNLDYLDSDSDNEGANDTTEAEITLTNNDTDGDGLDDATDSTIGYSDPGGTIDNPLTDPVTLPDTDYDISIGGDIDFRDATDELIDTDLDGVFDPVDIDMDNDGIVDSVECPPFDLSTDLNSIFIENKTPSLYLRYSGKANSNINQTNEVVYTISNGPIDATWVVISSSNAIITIVGNVLTITGDATTGQAGPFASYDIRTTKPSLQVTLDFNNVTSSSTTFTNFQLYGCNDSDGDGIYGFLDLDSDGDGIPDNIESQTTLGYIPPGGTDSDGNGLDDVYESNPGTGEGLIPVNTDGTDNPDYLDTNSDNEGGNDTTEAGISLANNDADNDGLDDATDATGNYLDPGGTIDDPLVAPIILPDTDNDVTAGGDLDYRDVPDVADLSLSKTVNNSNPEVGETITFTLVVTNNGPSSASSIRVRDVGPTNFTYTNPNIMASQGVVMYNTGTRTLDWLLGSYILSPGSSISLTYRVSVDVCGEFKNQAEIINSSVVDPDSSPNNGS